MLSISLILTVYSASASTGVSFRVSVCVLPSTEAITRSDKVISCPFLSHVAGRFASVTSHLNVTVSPSLHVWSVRGMVNSSGASEYEARIPDFVHSNAKTDSPGIHVHQKNAKR